ncbi:D-lactaldehyde dehydrogenase, partial [Coprinopsis sp. MPI-PUGE-AT-0042]
MPTISSNDKVLVTGANGFMALWIVKIILERENSVRAAIRFESKSSTLQRLFRSLPRGRKLLNTAARADFSDPNPKPEDFIQPAIKGTVGILQSALKYRMASRGYQLKSRSSSGSYGPPRLYTEGDWNEGAKAGVHHIYAAWDLYRQHQSEVTWDLSVILPPLPVLGEGSSPEALSGSVKFFWNFVVSDTPKPREALGGHATWVDVRDLAEAHVLALEKEKAGGERIFACAGSFVWQDLA